MFRSQVTDFEYEQRANTILHELAHMWFGDLVTMRWWDDLWLNESFAEWASHWSNAHATRYTDAWATFLSVRKNWGYRQDQLSTTHPVYCEMPDVAAVEVNFDGITYAKGAAWSSSSSPTSGSSVRGRAARLLRRARLGQRHLRRPARRAQPRQRPAAARVRRPVAGDRAGQHAAAGGRRSTPTAATARSRCGRRRRRNTRCCARTGSASVCTTWTVASWCAGDRLEVDIDGARDRGAGAGRRAAPPTCCCSTTTTSPTPRSGWTSGRWRRWSSTWPGLDSPLARACAGTPPGTWCGTPSWPPATTWRWSARLPTSPTSTWSPPRCGRPPARWRCTPTRRGRRPAGSSSPPPPGGGAAAAPGSGHQLAWARAFVGAARAEADLAMLRGWLAGEDVPEGVARHRAALADGAGAGGARRGRGRRDRGRARRDRTATGERAPPRRGR